MVMCRLWLIAVASKGLLQHEVRLNRHQSLIATIHYYVWSEACGYGLVVVRAGGGVAWLGVWGLRVGEWGAGGKGPGQQLGVGLQGSTLRTPTIHRDTAQVRQHWDRRVEAGE